MSEATGTAKMNASDPDPDQPGWFDRTWSRVAHVYKTRTRTTTIILIALFIGGLVLHGWAEDHYGPDQPARPEPGTVLYDDRGDQYVVPMTTEPAPAETSTTPHTQEQPEPTQESGETGQVEPTPETQRRETPDSSSSTESVSPTTSPRAGPAGPAGP